MSSSSSSTRPNQGPLTTLFVPPPSCSILGVDGRTVNVAFQAQHCYTTTPVSGSSSTIVYSNGVADDLSCWPTRAPGLTSPTPAFNGLGFYSPGLVCPSGYKSQCISALKADGSPSPVTSGTQFTFQFSLEPGETALGCCPHGYICTGGGYPYQQTCVSSVTSGVIPVTQCFDGTSTTSYDITVPITKASPTVSTVVAHAPLIQLVYKSSDAEAITIIRPTVTVTRTPQGLDSGDQAAIGVGVVALIFLVGCIVLGWLFLRLRRQRQTWATAPPPNSEDPSGGRVDRKEGLPSRELDGTPLNELGYPTAELGHEGQTR